MRLLIVLVVALFTTPVLAQDLLLQRRPYHDWPIYQDQQKQLPPGFFHFRPVSDEVAARRYDGGYFVVCRPANAENPVANAIAFARRLALGDSIPQAVDYMSRAHGGDIPCGYNQDTNFSPTAISVRGYDEGRETKRVLIIQVKDTSGNVFFMGVPR